MKGIEVRIRHVDESRSVPLCEARYDQLDDVIQQVKEWGVNFYEIGGTANDYTGHIVVEGGHAYFEIIIETTEE